MQVVNLKRDATTDFTLSNHVGWVWAAQEKSTDKRYFVMKAAASQIKSWGGRKQLKKMTSFFTLPPAKPLTSSLQTSVPKRQKNSDVQAPVVSCVIEDIIDVDVAGVNLSFFLVSCYVMWFFVVYFHVLTN